MTHNDTICALASGNNEAAISIIRLSGNKAFEIASKIFSPNSQRELPARKSILGSIKGEEVIDEGLMIQYPGPGSYTGEDLVEFNCHGSSYIVNQVLQLLISNGARLATPGEFTQRAFLNGKMDLSQAEAVADLIASESEVEHRIAFQQMKGGFSSELKALREQLMNFASLVELELDFSEEDVEFANRDQLTSLIGKIENKLVALIDSFSTGSAIKEGIPVTILGSPNAGKSTLLNRLLNEEKAIVTEIAGTTRDILEDQLIIEGVKFRFHDTAGLRDTEDKVESIGIQKALEQAGRSSILLHIFDASTESQEDILTVRKRIEGVSSKQTAVCVVANKIDLMDQDKDKAINKLNQKLSDHSFLPISAGLGWGIEELKKTLLKTSNSFNLEQNGTIVTNTRHYEALKKAHEAIANVSKGIESQISGDLLAVDIRKSLQHLGEITGEVTPDDILGTIFSKFCIGK